MPHSTQLFRFLSFHLSPFSSSSFCVYLKYWEKKLNLTFLNLFLVLRHANWSKLSSLLVRNRRQIWVLFGLILVLVVEHLNKLYRNKLYWYRFKTQTLIDPPKTYRQLKEEKKAHKFAMQMCAICCLCRAAFRKKESKLKNRFIKIKELFVMQMLVFRA